ncbi:hypothetical protein RvY_01766 [Ramazzottius varieornatus]|uniref:Hexosyltransferase n=1 Tax=Ramazzottius varieornatus TaxID=947166 RepID=A0A1D1UPJ2_RAMVA|nr:hypothetical protein RvY_01766 [Ramazzottius varieornatus]
MKLDDSEPKQSLKMKCARPGAFFLALLLISTTGLFLITLSCNRAENAPSFCSSGSFLDQYSPAFLSQQRTMDDSSSSSNSSSSISSFSAFDHFTVTPSSCSSAAAPFLLLIVFSRPNAFARRESIRRTFGSLASSCPSQTINSSTRSIRILFILGQVKDADLQEEIEREAKTYDDVVQSAAFVDGYAEATRKGIALFHWALLHCPQANFVAKADDDCWVNLPRFVKVLRKHQDKEGIFGLFWAQGAPVIRDPANKWNVPYADFPEDDFPPYVSGILYAVSRNVVRKLAEAVTVLKYLWHDDVFITGMAAKEAGVQHWGLAGYDVKGTSWKRTTCAKKAFLAIHYVNDANMDALWNDKCQSYEVPC